MNKLIVLLLLVFTGSLNTVAQDIITLKSGEKVPARILTLNAKDLIIIPENSMDTLSLFRSEVESLHYQNGIIIYLTENINPAAGNESAIEIDSMYSQGIRDANLYYKGYKVAATGTMICSFVYFPWGIIPAVACSSKAPLMKNLGYRDQQLIENPSYLNGYKKQAHKIKKKKVWNGFAIGSGTVVGISLLVSLALYSAY